jgi:raffinose/stachyose/melibiose transport system permease protein
MKNTRAIIIGIIAILGTAIFFLVPFVFVFLTASKPLAEANLLEFSWPEQFALFDNLRQALQTRDYLLVIAYINSFVLTIASVTGLVIFASMVAYVWQRRPAGSVRSSVSWCWPA